MAHEKNCDRKMLIVTNREPYTHNFKKGEVEYSEPVGGLTSALDPIVQECGGDWIAWGSGSADFDVTTNSKIGVPPENPQYDLHRVDLNKEEVSGYYEGFSNKILWPLCHGFSSKARFDEEYWSQYKSVNQKFANRAIETIDDHDVVWFHDYHFTLASGMVKNHLPDDCKLCHFWHISWPSWDIFQRFPHKQEIIDSLLANDVIGFHTESDVQKFLNCVMKISGIQETEKLLEFVDTEVVSSPLTVDYENFKEWSLESQKNDTWNKFLEYHDIDSSVGIMLGVDRLDYSKGILKRLESINQFFDSNPEAIGNWVYIQKGTKSRSNIDEYKRFQNDVYSKVSQINEKYSTENWKPIVYTEEHLSKYELSSLYRESDVLLVTSIKDGMNLVAKEFVSSSVKNEGKLILSEMAGVHDELGKFALSINPFDITQTKNQIENATGYSELPMSKRDEYDKMRLMRQYIAGRDKYEWIFDIIEA